MNIFFLDW